METNVELNRKKSEKEYFIAVIPPSPLYDTALSLKNYFKEVYQSKASLNSPPHITLHMPFKWKEQKESILIEKLSLFSKTCSSGEIGLKNFNAFPPRVIFLDVVSNGWLVDLQKQLHRFCKIELNLFNANHKDHPFHPHLTLAFRDLKKQKFIEAWQEFNSKKFDATFPVTEIILLKQDGKIWQPYKSFNLTSNLLLTK